MAVESNLKNMSLCLLVICLVCSGLLAGVYALTAEPIAKAAAAKTVNAIAAVVPAFDGEPARASIALDGMEYNYYSVSKDSSVVAYAIESSASGFGGELRLMVGVTADGIVYNTSVLSQSETPGLGAKCVEPAFSDQFRLWNPSEKKLLVRKDGGDVDAITASTITSRAYTDAIAKAVAVWAAINNETMEETGDEQ